MERHPQKSAHMINGTSVTSISPRLAPAWRAVERATPVPLRTIRSKSAYAATVRFMNSLIDVVGDNERHELANLLDFVGNLVRDYETRRERLPAPSRRQTADFLADQRTAYRIRTPASTRGGRRKSR